MKCNGSVKMKTKARPKFDAHQLISALNQANGNASHAADALDMPRSTFREQIKRAKSIVEDGTPATAGDIVHPQFADDDITVEENIEIMKKRFLKRIEHHASKKWFPVRIQKEGAVGLSFWGDPHVDDDGCHWPMLEHHCDLHRKTDGLYGVSVGDHTNNWVGRLARLYDSQETSKKTARKLAHWFLDPEKSGIDWAVIVMGNHDLWGDGADLLRAMSTTAVPMEDWSAQFKIVLPKTEVRVWCSHQFPGSSLWHSLHGMQRAALMKDWAHIYVGGHTHNWGIHQEENAHRDFVYWLCRSRGYKFIDEYADRLGFAEQQEGASITAIINPDAKSMSGLIQCYADMDQAVDYLNFLRRDL